jgi:hypothetical protein
MPVLDGEINSSLAFYKLVASLTITHISEKKKW